MRSVPCVPLRVSGTVAATAGHGTLSVSTVDLRSAHIGDAGAAAIARALIARPLGPAGRVTTPGSAAPAAAQGSGAATLTDLMLGHNDIGDAGAAALALVLRQPGAVLEALNLASNAVGDAGAVALASALTANANGSALKELCVERAGGGSHRLFLMHIKLRLGCCCSRVGSRQWAPLGCSSVYLIRCNTNLHRTHARTARP